METDHAINETIIMRSYKIDYQNYPFGAMTWPSYFEYCITNAIRYVTISLECNTSIHSVHEKIPPIKFRYFQKNFKHCSFIHASGQQQIDLRDIQQFHLPWNYGAPATRAICDFPYF